MLKNNIKNLKFTLKIIKIMFNSIRSNNVKWSIIELENSAMIGIFRTSAFKKKICHGQYNSNIPMIIMPT